nr:hypothetical protein [Tanacetum cinerariifolium]
ISLEKSQPDVIYKVCLEILQQYSFFNAFIATVDAPEIYMQQFWHTVTYDLTAKTYCFKIDDHIFKVNADLLRDALLITLKDSDHPFTLPPPENEIISFMNELGYFEPLTQGRLQLLIDQDFSCFKFNEEWSQIDATLGNLKLPNKGAKDPLFGIAIPMVMLNDEIKASADYSEYLAKSKGGKPKRRGKGLLTKKGVKVEVIEPVDSEGTKDDAEEPQLTRKRQTRVVIGRVVHTVSDEGTVDHSKMLKVVIIGNWHKEIEKAKADKVNDDKAEEEKDANEQARENKLWMSNLKRSNRQVRSSSSQKDFTERCYNSVKSNKRKLPSKACQNEDNMDKQLDDQPSQAEIRHDDQDPPTDADKESKMRKRKDSDETLSKKSKDEDTSSKEDDLVDTQDDTTPTQDRSKWFKQDAVVRPPNPKWHKEPNENDAREQNWFNYMDKIIKADLKGPTFKLLKGNYRNYIELEYIIEQCCLAVTDQMDWANLKGDKYPYDLSKPLPLQGPLGRTTIPVDFFNKDMEFLKIGNT